MDILIRLRTPLQAVAAFNAVGLNERQRGQLITALIRQGTIESLIALEDPKIPPKLLLELCSKRMQEIGVEQAGRLLSMTPCTRPYATARMLLLKKFLRQPIYEWLEYAELDDALHPVHNDPITAGEITLCAGVIVRSRLPAYAREFLDFARPFKGLDQTMLKKLERLAKKADPEQK